jgi:probable rRNA maturation factor
MSRVVEVSAEGLRVPVAQSRVAAAADRVLRAEGVRDAAISIAFVTDRRIAALNWKHLRHRGPTDVISFAFATDIKGAPLTGDIYIAPNVARRNARAEQRGVREELLRLVVHGVLHVLGHDHPEGDARYESPMWRRQETLLCAALRADGAT